MILSLKLHEYRLWRSKIVINLKSENRNLLLIFTGSRKHPYLFQYYSWSNHGRKIKAKTNYESIILLFFNTSEKHHNPYFLHHGNSPGCALVPELLARENYPIWSRSLVWRSPPRTRLALLMDPLQTMIVVIKNILPRHAAKYYDPIMNLLNSVPIEIAASIIFLDSTLEMWKDLNDRLSNLIYQEFIKKPLL